MPKSWYSTKLLQTLRKPFKTQAHGEPSEVSPDAACATADALGLETIRAVADKENGGS